jgi:NAD(P)H-dependent flavin oxidoreductase YrpB (nitropropane dioxygenase family)
VQLPNLAALYGAMLAGVQHVLMGAGIPREIPAVLDGLAEHRAVRLRLDVEAEEPGRSEMIEFDPLLHWVDQAPVPIGRPTFIAIVASNSLATMLARKASGRIDGFVIEGPTAGGHNAPPRGPLQLSADGEPVYGPRDVVDLTQLGELGLPFWVAGGAGTPDALASALAAGAAGIQVGTLFAYCDESGLAPEFKHSVLRHALRDEVTVHTDPLASPTGYPFKVVQWPEDPTAGQPEPRTRRCDIGLLRVAYRRDDGRIGYRCPAEPVEDYLAKGGTLEDTVSRRCLCNALFADIGLPQVMDDGGLEPPLVTSGDDLMTIGRFLAGRECYAADDVLDYLLAGTR